jgi:cytochrome oxidase assembly protein ShyY1
MKCVLFAAAASILTALASWQLLKAGWLKSAAEWCHRKAREG